jgi:hypothetical protein
MCFTNKTRSHGNDLSNVATAVNHTTIEELLEVVFSMFCTTTITTQQHGEHASAATMVWSVLRAYQWDEA